jgi:hypothetical protein
MSWVAVSIVAYIVFNFRQWKKTKKTNWPAHHLFISCAVCWWLMHLGPDKTGSYILISTHHAIPYLLIGYKYITADDSENKRSKFLLPGLLYLTTVALAFAFMRAQNSLPKDSLLTNLVIIFHTSIITSHYVFDMFLWNKSYNPGWTKVFSKRAAEVPGKEILRPDLAA